MKKTHKAQCQSSWNAFTSIHTVFILDRYSCTNTLELSSLPCRFGHNAKIVHFTGAVKPWSSGSRSHDSHSHIMEHFVSLWWKEYHSYSASSLPGKQIRQNLEKPQQVRTSRGAAKIKNTYLTCGAIYASRLCRCELVSFGDIS